MLKQSSAIRSCLRSSAWRRASATTRGGKPANSATKAPQNRSTSVIVLSSNVSGENMKSNISSLEWTEISNCLSGHIVHVYDSIAVFLFKKNTKYLILQHIGSMAITLICSSIGQGIKECQPEIAWEVDWLGSRGKSLLENLEFPFPPSKNTTLPWDNPPAALRLDDSGRMPVLLRNRWQHSKISKRETRRNMKRKKSQPVPHCRGGLFQSCQLVEVSGKECEASGVLQKSRDLCARVTSSK